MAPKVNYNFRADFGKSQPSHTNFDESGATSSNSSFNITNSNRDYTLQNRVISDKSFVPKQQQPQ